MPWNPSKLALACCLLLVVSTLAVAHASAQSGTFGEPVDIGDPGVVRVLEDSEVPDTWAWLDSNTEDDEDDYDGGQSVYLVTTTSRFSKNDLRMPGGSQIDARSLDDDEDLESLGGSLRYLDEDGDGRFGADDGLYYDVSGDGNTGEISDLDIHIAGASGSDGTDLDGISERFTYVDRDGDGAYSQGDDVYLDADGDDRLTAADVGISGDHRGQILDGDDRGITHVLETSGAPDSWAFRDDDGDGTLGQQEPVYLAASTSSLSLHDVRAANAPTGGAGSQVRSGDGDLDDGLTALSGDLAFYDADGDNAFSEDDTLYMDRTGSGSGQVSVNDLVLSGAEAGRLATSDDENVGSLLGTLSADFAYDDQDGDGVYGKDDHVYLDIGARGYVSVFDVELTPDLGHRVTLEDEDATLLPSSSGAPDRILVVENDGDGRPQAEDPIYVDTSTDQVSIASVRLAAPPVSVLGSQVRAGDPDHGDGTSQVSGDLTYLDADDDEAFTEQDTLYVDLSGGGSDEVSAGDLILSGSDAGTLVTAGSSDQGRSLRDYPGRFAFLDGDANDAYGLGDGIVLDTDDDGFLTVGDVWFRGPNVREPEQPSGPRDAGDTEPEPDGTDDRRSIEVRVGSAFDAAAGQRVRFTQELPENLSAFGLTLTEACQGCTANLARTTQRPNATPEPPAGWRAVAFWSIELVGPSGTSRADAVEAGYLAFQIPREGLAEGTQAGQITLARYEGAWKALETRLTSSPAADLLGYNASLPGLSAFAIAVDEQAPEIAAHEPTGSTVYRTPALKIAWTDNRAVDPASATLRIDGQLQTEETGSLQVTASELSFVPGEPLSMGEHTVDVSVMDVSGLEQSFEWRFRVSDATCPTPPRITDVTPPPDGTVPPGANIRVNVSATSCPIEGSSLHVDGIEIPSAYGARVLTGLVPTSFGPGEAVTISAQVTDAGGNTAAQTWAVDIEEAGTSSEDQNGSGLGAVWTVVALMGLAAAGRGALDRARMR